MLEKHLPSLRRRYRRFVEATYYLTVKGMDAGRAGKLTMGAGSTPSIRKVRGGTMAFTSILRMHPIEEWGDEENKGSSEPDSRTFLWMNSKKATISSTTERKDRYCSKVGVISKAESAGPSTSSGGETCPESVWGSRKKGTSKNCWG